MLALSKNEPFCPFFTHGITVPIAFLEGFVSKGFVSKGFKSEDLRSEGLEPARRRHLPLRPVSMGVAKGRTAAE